MRGTPTGAAQAQAFGVHVIPPGLPSIPGQAGVERVVHDVAGARAAPPIPVLRSPAIVCP